MHCSSRLPLAQTLLVRRDPTMRMHHRHEHRTQCSCSSTPMFGLCRGAPYMLRNFGLIKSDCCWKARSLAGRRNVVLHAACRAGGFETWHRVVYTELLLTLKVSCTSMTRMWSYLCGNIFVCCAASGPIGSTGGAKAVRCLVRWPCNRLRRDLRSTPILS